MASVLHGSARTTPRIRAEPEASQAPAPRLAGQYDLNVKTVPEWRRRDETKILTDNGMAFADLPGNREGATRRFMGRISSTASALSMGSSTG